MRRAIAFVSLAVLSGVVLSAAVFRSDIASATGLAQSVTVNNPPAQAVPVREQNRDASGNIKVHEQGTADVNVTNGSLTVAPPAPVTGGGDFWDCVASSSGGSCSQGHPDTATALAIHMTPGIVEIELYESDTGDAAAWFVGPADHGNADVVLALDRPIRFDQVKCFGVDGDSCRVGVAGDTP